jgi:ubiquinone biosynthesis protein
LGRELYPELDLWKTAQPVLRQWMRERISPLALMRRVRAQLPDTLDVLQQVPRLLKAVVRDAADGKLRIAVHDPAIEALREEIRIGNLRRDAAIVAAVLWLSGLVSLALFAQYYWFGCLQMGAGILVFFWYRTSRSRLE